MFSIDALRDLYRHMKWADGEVWRAVHAATGAQKDGTIRQLLLHIHQVQKAFMDVWTGRPPAFRTLSELPDLVMIHDWSRPYYAEAFAFLDQLDERALERPVVMPWAEELAKQMGRPPSNPTLAETMFQVTSHSTYHRGQVNIRLRALGGEPPLVDYIGWVWFGRPEAGSG